MHKIVKALAFTAAMLGLTAAAPTPAQEELVEIYQLNSLEIIYQGTDVLFLLNATSDQDSTGKPLTVSGLNTELSIGFKNDEGGVFGGNIPDIRPRFKTIKFHNPDLNNLAEVELTVETDDGSDNRNIFRVSPGRFQKGGNFGVQKLVFYGDEIPVTINGDNTGKNDGLANRLVGETINGGWTFKLMLQGNCPRRHLPENGNAQLPPVCETLKPF